MLHRHRCMYSAGVIFTICSFVFSISASCSEIARSHPAVRQNPLNHLCKLTRCIFIFPSFFSQMDIKTRTLCCAYRVEGRKQTTVEESRSLLVGAKANKGGKVEVFAFFCCLRPALETFLLFVVGDN